VAIVTEAMALQFFKTRDVLGRDFRVQDGKGQSPSIRIVGVVKDSKYQSLREKPQPTVYLDLAQDSIASARMSVEVRAPGGAVAIEPAVKAALAEVEPKTTESFVTFSTQIADSMKQEQLLAVLSALFGGLALLLAMLGLYGVMSYNVARRRGEIGIRMALGAGQRRVAGMVMREVSAMVVIGLAVGTGLAIGTTRLLSTFLFGLGATDPATFGGAMCLLAGVALLAAYLPARRAARIDPMDALRED
jgi:ABC-type antimicrobial peptide transport system permease subunit